MESKSLPASSSSDVPSAKLLPLSLYVVAIWKQDSENAQRYVHCLAGVAKLDELVTTHHCAYEIVEAFDSHKNFRFPQFSATIGDLSHNTVISLKILKPLIREGFEITARRTTIIPVSHQIENYKKNTI